MICQQRLWLPRYLEPDSPSGTLRKRRHTCRRLLRFPHGHKLIPAHLDPRADIGGFDAIAQLKFDDGFAGNLVLEGQQPQFFLAVVDGLGLLLGSELHSKGVLIESCGSRRWINYPIG
jgi:hypothetical protein